jgi:quinol monooxygenase YgiN
MPTLVIIGSAKAKPAQADAFRKVLKELLLPTLAEEGCLRYEMNESEEGDSWIFTELWESRELWDRHMESPHLARYKAVVQDMAEYWTLFKGHMVRPGT